MNTTILIAPYEGPFAFALAREASAAGWTVILAKPETSPAPPPGRAEDEEAPLGESGISVAWNPLSYVSTSALFLAARNASGQADAVVIISRAADLGVDLVGGRPGEIEAALMRETLGPALVARECLRAFEAGKPGSLVLLGGEGDAGGRGPAAALAAGAFKGLGEGLFAASREAAWEAFGILDKGGDPGETARFLLRLIAEKKGGKSGRWLRFAGKPGLFGVF